MLRHFAWAIAAFLTLALTSAVQAAPLEAYTRLPAMSNVAISPDGQSVAYVAMRQGVQLVIIQRLSGEVAQQIAAGDAKIRDVEWANNDYVVMTTSTTEAVRNVTMVGEQFQAVSIDVRTGQAAQFMTRSRGESAYVNVLYSNPVYGTYQGQAVAYVVALAASGNSSQAHVDVARVNLNNGWAFTAQMGDENTADFVISPDGQAVAQLRYQSDVGHWSVLVRQGGAFHEADSGTALIDHPELAGLSADGSAVLVHYWDDQEKGWHALPVSIASLQKGEPVTHGGSYTLLYNPDQRMVGQFISDGDNRAYSFVDPAVQANWQGIVRAFPGAQVYLNSHTPDFSRMIVYVEGGQFAGNYLLFDSASGRMTQIGRSFPELAAADIGEVRPIHYAAADGLDIHGYLTLPRGRDPHNLPLVVLPHGGPQARDTLGFDWMAQAVAARGYAVLQVNFRGSTGYGEDFVEAAYGEWGHKMQTDLSDGVAYLAHEGIVDRARVCIMGASYGGYAALAGVTLQDGIYRCAVSISGVADVPAMLDPRQMPTEGTESRYWRRYLGVDSVSDPKLRAISPVNAAANGHAPVLLIHGQDDTTVLYSQSTSMQNALRRAGRTVELVTLPGEDHGLSRQPTRQAAMTAALAFLEQNNPPN